MTPERRARYEAKLARLGQRSFQGRLEALLDPGSIKLMNAPDWDAAWDQATTTVTGTIAGKAVYAYATNFLVDGGTLGHVECHAIASLHDRAAREGAPIAALLHSNGARVAEHHQALAANAVMFKAITRASGASPMVAVCTGLALGSAAYMAALADFCWMVEGGSWAATTSPAVVKVATGQAPSLDELGAASLHARHSGVAHFLAASEQAAIAGARSQLALLAGPTEAQAPDGPPPELAVPADPRLTYDMRKLIHGLVDADSFLESHTHWARGVVTGFARFEGRPVGIIANQPKVKSGVLDAENCRKAARFAQAADAWGLPLVYLVDVPGIMVSAHEERRGVLDAGAVFFHAVDTDVPRISVVVRKCFGGSFVMLQARQAGGDCVMAWPDAQIGIAGPEVAFAIMHGKEALTHADAGAFKAGMVEALTRTPTDAESAREAGLIDAVVQPADTRRAIADALSRFPRLLDRDRPPRRRAVMQV